jgi:hypothetical protein
MGWHVVRRGIDMRQVSRFPRNKVIGTKSKHGVVRPLSYKGNPLVLVSKEVPLRQKKAFMREVRIGSLKGIEACGPRVYAWRIKGDRCEYVMDHFARGHRDAKVQTLAQYNGEPKPWRQLYRVLMTFYKLTGGFHGDLHMNNIAVVTRKRKVTVQVYDYGTWHKFERRVTGNKIMPYLLAARRVPGNKNLGYAYEPKNYNQLYTRNLNVLNNGAVRAFKRFNASSSSD